MGETTFIQEQLDKQREMIEELKDYEIISKAMHDKLIDELKNQSQTPNCISF